MPYFESIKWITNNKIVQWMSPLKIVILCVKNVPRLCCWQYWRQWPGLSLQMYACYEMYSKNIFDRHENLFLDTFLCHNYSTILHEQQYLNTLYNITTNISIEEDYAFQTGHETLLLGPLLLQFCVYCYNEESQSPYILQ